MAVQRVTELRVGLFVVIGGILAVATLFTIGSRTPTFGRKTYLLSAHFSSIAGLRSGATVQLAGMKIGTVQSMHFSPDLTENSITVTMKLNQAFADRIRADSKAIIETQGLLGDKYISITVGSPGQPIVPDGGLLAAGEAVSIANVAEKAGAAIEDIHNVSKALSRLFQEQGADGEGNVAATLRSLRHTIEEIEKGEGLLHALIYDPQGKEILKHLAETTQSTRDVMESVKGGEGTLGRMVRDPELYEELRTLLGKVNRNKLLKTVIRSMLEENEKQVLK